MSETTALCNGFHDAAKPAVKKEGGNVVVSFAVAAPTDVEVAVLAADGKERIRELQAKVVELTMENSFLEGALGKFPGLSGKR